MQFCNLFVIIRPIVITKCNFYKDVTIIFKDLLNKETLSEIFLKNNKFKAIFDFAVNNKILMKICCLALIGIMSIGISIISVGITLGFNVDYEGSTIATVKDSTVFEDAKSIAVKNIDSKAAEDAIKTPSFKMTLTVADKLSTATILADKIIENTNEIVKATALVVNGEKKLYAETEELKAALEAARIRFEIKGAENTSEFTDDIKLINSYYLADDVKTGADVKAVVETINVKTVSKVTTNTEIAFSKKTVKDDNKLIGYSKVKTAGVKGLKTKVETVENVNGTETLRTELSSKVVKEPVTQVVVVGTAKTNASPAQRSEERSAGFICPLKRGKFVVSAYYGDGRNHKGIDLAADKGTPIYAVSGGTVTASGYSGAYGYRVVIDHGNGLVTKYAHASALCVSKGQTVKQGDVIAYVGNSGRSTGNHLHFEVVKNGSQRNPVSYIGLD